MGSKNKGLREQIEFLEIELAKRGIPFETRKVNSGHMIMSFVVNGQNRALTIAATHDRNARLRNRTILRGILEGRR